MSIPTPIDPSDGPGTRPSYAQATLVTAGSTLLFISGQAPQTPDGVIPESFEEQCRLAWSNLVAVLGAAGMTIQNLAKVTIVLRDRRHQETNTRIRREFLGDHRPAVLYLLADLWIDAWQLEIDAVAAA